MSTCWHQSLLAMASLCVRGMQDGQGVSDVLATFFQINRNRTARSRMIPAFSAVKLLSKPKAHLNRNSDRDPPRGDPHQRRELTAR